MNNINNRELSYKFWIELFQGSDLKKYNKLKECLIDDWANIRFFLIYVEDLRDTIIWMAEDWFNTQRNNNNIWRWNADEIGDNFIQHLKMELQKKGSEGI